MRKAITPIISVVIILLITVALAGSAYTFIGGYYSGLTRGAIEATSSYCSSGIANILVRNIGQDPILLPSQRMQTEPYKPDPDTIMLMHFEDEGKTILDSSENSNDGTLYGSTVLLMHLDEGSGTTASDESAYRNEGTVTGATWVSGRSGMSLSFDGDDEVSVQDSSTLDFDEDDSFTIEAWVKVQSADENRDILGKRASGIWGGSPGYVLRMRGSDPGPYGYPVLAIDDGSQHTAGDWGTIQINDGNWHYLAGVVDRGEKKLKLYIDGVLDKEVDISSFGSLSNTDSLKLGKASTTSPFKGILDEVAIHRVPLSAEEIRARYDAGRAKFSEFVSGAPGLGKGVDFDGVNDYVETILKDTQQSPFTVEAWVQQRSRGLATVREIVNKNSVPASTWDDFPFALYFTSDQRVVGEIDSGGDYIADATVENTAVPLDIWHHIAVTYDFSNLRLYVDGVLTEEGAPGITLSSNSLPYTIGRASSETGPGVGQTGFNGIIDEVRISSIARDFSQPQQGWFYACAGAGAGPAQCGSLQVEKTSGEGGDVLYFDKPEILPGQTATLKSPCSGTCTYRIASGGVVATAGAACF